MTSASTNAEIIKVLNKHLTKQQQNDLFHDLSKVAGNKSFTDSINNILKLIKNAN